MTVTNKIVTSREQFFALQFHQVNIRHVNHKMRSNGSLYNDGDSDGDGDGDGATSPSGRSTGSGNSTQNHLTTDISDPMNIRPLVFVTPGKERYEDRLTWDEAWDLCNDEQKQHLLLFLPLR